MKIDYRLFILATVLRGKHFFHFKRNVIIPMLDCILKSGVAFSFSHFHNSKVKRRALQLSSTFHRQSSSFLANRMTPSVGQPRKQAQKREGFGPRPLQYEPQQAVALYPILGESVLLEGGLAVGFSSISVHTCEVIVRLHLYLHLWHHEAWAL